MILIVDSGSTKTTWAVVGSDSKFVTEGLNPHFTTDDQFLAACGRALKEFTPQPPSRGDGRNLLPPLRGARGVKDIFFYGSGCGSPAQRDRVAALLRHAFPSATVHVETDMLGACRALCGHGAALVGILGTGSNACYYDGSTILHNAVSTGFILGDEGSANHVGRRLLQDYLAGIMPQPLSVMFHEAYPMSKEDFLDAVYHTPNANRFLASLARFAVEHIADDYPASVVEESLRQWYRYQLAALQGLSQCNVLNVVGGFAARIKPQLGILAKDCGLKLGTVVADPMDGLLRYHSLP